MEHKSIMRLLKSSFMMGVLLVSTASWAESWVDRTRLDGFFSARYSITNEKALWQGGLDESGINEDGSFYGTKLGLGISSRVSDRLTVATQLFAPIQENSYDLHVDWAFATFTLTDQLDLRAGKIKYPVGIVNEYVEVGVTYPWIQARWSSIPRAWPVLRPPASPIPAPACCGPAMSTTGVGASISSVARWIWRT